MTYGFSEVQFYAVLMARLEWPGNCFEVERFAILGRSWCPNPVCFAGSVTGRSQARLRLFGRSRGFSLLEMVVSLAVLLILSAIAVPTLMRAYRSYLLSDATSRVAGIMKFTRFEAIRKNTVIGFQVQQSGNNWIVWTDTNANGVPDSSEVQVVLTGTVTFLSSGVPGNGQIATALGGAAPALSVVSGSNQNISFDGRGAVKFSGSQAVYVFYLGNANIPDMGARAVVLLPSGIVQTWTVKDSSTWARLS